jgi:hypothetical protein
MGILIAAAIVAPLLLACWLIDRRGRKRGHPTGDPSAITRAAGEGRSDARAIDAIPSMTKDLSWTSAHRSNKR